MPSSSDQRPVPLRSFGRQATIMCMAASSSKSGFFAYSNSNNDEDATLKMVVPAGAAR
jgi:hypothetical protein